MRNRFAAAAAGRRSFSFALPVAATCAIAAVSFARIASAATLQVGSGQMYATPCAAIAAAQPGDEIDIQAATYNDTCAINTAGIHLKGVGGQPKIDITGVTPAQEKGIYSVQADNVIIENLELTGAAISDDEGGNGAGLRIQSNGVQVLNCYIHDNQDGILAGPTSGDGQGTLTISHTEFKGNAVGDGCSDGVACTHNVYIGDYAKLIFQFNYTHALNADSSARGHLLKSRALESDVLYNKITQEGSSATSYEIDLPNAGLGIIEGNVIEKGPNSGNSILLDYGEEGPGSGTNALYVAYNTFINANGGSATFINVDSRAQPGLAALHDNIFAGMGTTPMGAAPDNFIGDPMFVNAASYDYHLMQGSPAVGKAMPPGSAGNFSLTPVFEYVDPLGAVSRTAASDIGAFELGTNVTDPSTDAGAELPDGAASSGSGVGGGGDGGGGTKTASDGGTSGGSGTGTADGGGTTTGTGTATGTGTVRADGGVVLKAGDGGSEGDGDSSSSDGGCSIGASGSGSGLSFAGFGLVALAALVRRRRRTSK